jgi:hypothetical protein
MVTLDGLSPNPLERIIKIKSAALQRLQTHASDYVVAGMPRSCLSP